MTRTLSTPPTLASGCFAGAGAPQPVLPVAGGGLLLRPWERADARAFFSAYEDAETRRWHTHRPSTVAQVEEWFDRYRQDWEREKGCHWAVARDSGEVLGRMALRGVDFEDGVANAAYWVPPDRTRRGGRLPRPRGGQRVGAGRHRLSPAGVGPLDA
ncbi:Acetyltransferase (GNAT) domain-containing protein [Streptomyces sp. Ncost-T6T-2b]|nr:Acetyltransferase (GNAT) domain-containing protein [Streptomyces sp. Ncost-T6T-2b]